MRKIKRREHKPEITMLLMSGIVEDALGMNNWYPISQIRRNNLLLVLDKDIDKQKFSVRADKVNPNLAYYFRYLYGKWQYYLENPPGHYLGPEDKYQGWFYLRPKDASIWFEGFRGLNNYQTRRNYTKQLVKSSLILRQKIPSTPPRVYYKINMVELLRRYELQLQRTKEIALQFVNFDKLDCQKEGDFDKTFINNILIKRSFPYGKDKKTSFSKNPSLDSTTKSPLRKKLTSRSRDIKRRSDNPPIDKVISHWSNLGYPLAKVNKPEVLYPLIHKAKTKLGYKEIIKVIDRGFEYFKNPDFKFANAGKKIPMKSFFVKPTFAKDPATILFQKNKIRNWCIIFRNKSDEWIEDNCLTTPKINSIKNFKFLVSLLPNRHNQHKKNDIIRASNKMSKFFSINKFEFQGTIETDMTNFFRQGYPDMDKFKVYWMKSDNFWNRQVAQYLVDYGRFDRINEVKKI